MPLLLEREADDSPGQAGAVEVALQQAETMALELRRHAQAALEQRRQRVGGQLLPGLDIDRAVHRQAAPGLQRLERGFGVAAEIAVDELVQRPGRETGAQQVGLDALGDHAAQALGKPDP